MYAWIWRHLPFGRVGKVTGSVLLVSLVGALLWYVVFPWAEPLLPFDDVQDTNDSGQPDGDTDPGAPPPGEPSTPGDEHDLPYRTDQNNPDPSSTPRR